jgi:ElaB/YqjD/DUF883 family membrane-anchored ribosome-binding protein
MTSNIEADVNPTATTDELRQQARAVKEDLRGLGRAAKDVAQEKLAGAKQKASDALDTGKQKTAGYYQRSKERASAVGDQVENYIREKPLKSVLIAAGVGLGLGVLLSRR